ncbi:ftsH Extracellular family protein [Mycobacterium kansasii]|uniref:FtsH Extracellular family protein n=1 Tax=Mycobacterium kansasii TaxID=1768 RepID=A0A1V3XBA7_MYCKA|nr:ftsH Extracellular family protein [Mycobacterium kansasii]
MNRKNVIRTLTAIAVVVLLGWSFFYFSDDTRGYKPVDTSVAVAQINSDNVKSAQIDDREQQLRLTLKKGNNDTDGSDKVITKYPTGYAVDLFNALTAKNAKVSTVVNQGSILGELLVYVLPLLLLVGLFVMFSRMQGGARMGFGFGKSRPRCSTRTCPRRRSPTLPESTRPSRSSTRSRISCRTPAATRRWAPRSPGVCCCTVRPERARRCWPAPSRVRLECRSSPSPARTSSRCSSVSAPRASGTCSIRPNRTTPASSSSTRSTRWAASAAPAWAAATTSASRRSTSSWSRWTASTRVPASF